MRVNARQEQGGRVGEGEKELTVVAANGDPDGSQWIKVPPDNYLGYDSSTDGSNWYHGKFQQIYTAMADLLKTKRVKERADADADAPAAGADGTRGGAPADTEGAVLSDCLEALKCSGFVEFGREDMQICEALNAGYLLRLSLEPDLRNLDGTMREDFFAGDPAVDVALQRSDPMFDGKVLVFRRGYSTEVTRGKRLIIPKLDYLQAAVLQTNVRRMSDDLSNKVDQLQENMQENFSRKDPSAGPSKAVAAKREGGDRVSLKRYWRGSNPKMLDPSQALEPYIRKSDDEDCDQNFLVRRVSLSDVVDLFSPGGRRRLARSLFSKSTLIEPTYKELIVICRRLPPTVTPVSIERAKNALRNRRKRRRKTLGVSPRDPKGEVSITIFKDVPMANVLACLPKSKLVFRPADAIRLDVISAFTGLAVFATLRLDSPNPKFKIIAIVSVCVWFLRLFFRYSNSLARYDLLKNKFLTSKIANKGLYQVHSYLLNEAALAKARKASRGYDWLLKELDFDERDIEEGVDLLSDLEIVDRETKDFVSDKNVTEGLLRQKWNSLY